MFGVVLVVVLFVAAGRVAVEGVVGAVPVVLPFFGAFLEDLAAAVGAEDVVA